MVTQIGSTYISESMIDIVEIPTENLGFMTTESSKKVLESDCGSDRQPEIVTWRPKPEIRISS